MWLLVIGIICLVLAVATVPLALRLPSRSSVLTVAAVMAVVGVVAGVFCSFHVRWQPSPTIRQLGFPFPAIIWQLEDGRWIDFVGGPITAVMNVFWFVGVCIVPVFAWVVLQRPWRSAAGR